MSDLDDLKRSLVFGPAEVTSRAGDEYADVAVDLQASH
jgi:hypothetical protein